MNEHILPVALEKAFRLITHGPTVLVSARHEALSNVMAASWVCALDYDPPKLTLALGRDSKTRELIEKSSRLVVQVPTVAQVRMVHEVGTRSLAKEPDKLERSGVQLFDIEGYDLPFVSGCAAWLACEIVSEPHNQETYDLFIARVTAAWADDRVFRNGHWNFETAAPEWRSLHYISGGQFYAIGEAVRI